MELDTIGVDKMGFGTMGVGAVGVDTWGLRIYVFILNICGILIYYDCRIFFTVLLTPTSIWFYIEYFAYLGILGLHGVMV